MNQLQDEDYENATDYLYKNYTMNDIFQNKDIIDMHDREHYLLYTIRCRNFIERLNKKYIGLYNYCGIFSKDLNNITWERVFNIVYDNIHNEFDKEFINNNAEEIIDILEK